MVREVRFSRAANTLICEYWWMIRGREQLPEAILARLFSGWWPKHPNQTSAALPPIDCHFTASASNVARVLSTMSHLQKVLGPSSLHVRHQKARTTRRALVDTTPRTFYLNHLLQVRFTRQRELFLRTCTVELRTLQCYCSYRRGYIENTRKSR